MSYDLPPSSGDQPYHRRPRTTGRAGEGLQSDEAVSRYGRSAAVGASGERYFGAALERAGLGGSYSIWHSRSIPRDPRGGGTNYRGDVDTVIASGKKVLLVDVKKWQAGVVYWSLFGHPMKGFTPMMKDGQWRLSANMATAVDRYRANLPGVEVQAIVVFVPTSKNGGVPTVKLLKWPGGIRSYLTNDGLKAACRFLGTPEPADPKVLGLLNRLGR